MNCFTLAAVALGMFVAAAPAAEISTHVLDLARGVGGRDVPVVLLKKAGDGRWIEVGRARTDENGRVRSFGTTSFDPGTYKLQFDMTGYPSPTAAPFFPEIDLVFTVTDRTGHSTFLSSSARLAIRPIEAIERDSDIAVTGGEPGEAPRSAKVSNHPHQCHARNRVQYSRASTGAQAPYRFA